jgi:hypothetical protein
MRLFETARETYAAVSLNVRQSSPAVRLDDSLGFRSVAGSETA